MTITEKFHVESYEGNSYTLVASIDEYLEFTVRQYDLLDSHKSITCTLTKVSNNDTSYLQIFNVEEGLGDYEYELIDVIQDCIDTGHIRLSQEDVVRVQYGKGIDTCYTADKVLYKR